MQHARGGCALRAQVIPLVHLDGRPTAGREGRCIFCGAAAPAPYHHTFGECPTWSAERDVLRKKGTMGGKLGHLGAVLDVLRPNPLWAKEALAMAGKVEASARHGWYEHGGGPESWVS